MVNNNNLRNLYKNDYKGKYNMGVKTLGLPILEKWEQYREKILNKTLTIDEYTNRAGITSEYFTNFIEKGSKFFGISKGHDTNQYMLQLNSDGTYYIGGSSKFKKNLTADRIEAEIFFKEYILEFLGRIITCNSIQELKVLETDADTKNFKSKQLILKIIVLESLTRKDVDFYATILMIYKAEVVDFLYNNYFGLNGETTRIGKSYEIMKECYKILNIPDSNKTLDVSYEVYKMLWNEYEREYYSKKLKIDDDTEDANDLIYNKENNIFHKNLILYGPPGTGKTYNSIIYAVAIVESETKTLEDVQKEAENNYSAVKSRYDTYIEEGKIAFTTFHQSYGYEEFIEGIKPKIENEDEDSDLGYRYKDGIFKAFCNNDIKDNKNRLDVFDDAWGKLVEDSYNNQNRYTFVRSTGTTFSGEFVKNGNSFKVIWNNGSSANTITKSLVKEQWQNKIDRDSLNNGGYKWAYDAREAILQELTKFGLPKYMKEQDHNSPRVFIIDEINRGNISKIFGELITLIEDTKRLGQKEEMKAKLPYTQEEFGVPNNVYILGTMNTADRSISLIDTALRRRFAFEEKMPNSDLLKDIVVDGINVKNVLDTMNKRIEYLYDREHQIGHSFFMKLKDGSTIENLSNIFKDKIIPLLQEYFYDDYDKIRLVLGDNQKKDEKTQFVKKVYKKSKDLFGDDKDDDFDDKAVFEINNDAFEEPHSYRFLGNGQIKNDTVIDDGNTAEDEVAATENE